MSEYSYKQESNSCYRDYIEYQGNNINYYSIIINSIFCLFDGHGGKEISTYLQNYFPLFLKNIYLQIT